jgi:hypothetical protein
MEPVELHRRLCDLISGDAVRGRKIYLTSGALCMRTPEEARAGEVGFYHPDPFGRGPAIWLWRKVAGQVDDHAEELVTLAHEYGHALSDKFGERPRLVMPDPAAALTDGEKDMVEAEEARAWAHGHTVLEDLDPGYDFALFDSRKGEADAIYARLLAR